MTAKTPIYGLEYLVQGEPARNTRLALENNAKTIEAALQARGVAAANASDVLAVSGRVSVLEADKATTWVNLTLASPFVSYAAPTTYPAVSYRVEGRRVWLRGWLLNSGGATSGTASIHVGPLPAAVRPVGSAATTFAITDTGTPKRFEITTAGMINSYGALAANTYLNLEAISWAI